jgi:hypothetical protein
VGVAGMALGQDAAYGDETDREGGRDGKEVPLQEHLPTDFAG